MVHSIALCKAFLTVCYDPRSERPQNSSISPMRTFWSIKINPLNFSFEIVLLNFPTHHPQHAHTHTHSMPTHSTPTHTRPHTQHAPNYRLLNSLSSVGITSKSPVIRRYGSHSTVLINVLYSINMISHSGVYKRIQRRLEGSWHHVRKEQLKLNLC